MTLKSKLIIAFGVVFLSVCLFIIGVIFLAAFLIIPLSSGLSAELDRKRSAETSGKITSYTSRPSYDYEYVVDGVLHKNSQGWGGIGSQSIGMKVKVCYDPTSPKSAEFYRVESNKICGQ